MKFRTSRNTCSLDRLSLIDDLFALIQIKIQEAWGRSETNPSPHARAYTRKKSAQKQDKILSTWGNEHVWPRSEWGNSMRGLWPLLPQATAWGRRTVLDASSPSCLICEWCSSIKGTYTANDPLFIAPKPFFYSSELLEFGPGFETCRAGFERDDLHCSDRAQVRSHCRGNEREREGIVCTCIEPGRPGRPL